MSDRDVTVAPDDYTAKLMAEVERLQGENARLRERITTQKQTIQAYRDESREWREVAEHAQAENDKLRELVRDMGPFVKAGTVHACPNRECCLFEECDADSERECPIEEHMAARMRVLGIEVE